jgi:hypothetical protein
MIAQLLIGLLSVAGIFGALMLALYWDKIFKTKK